MRPFVVTQARAIQQITQQLPIKMEIMNESKCGSLYLKLRTRERRDLRKYLFVRLSDHPPQYKGNFSFSIYPGSCFGVDAIKHWFDYGVLPSLDDRA